MDTIAIALTIVFIGYMILTDKLVGTAYSISDSFYSWKKKNYSSAFVIFLTLIAVGLWFVVDKADWKHDASPVILSLSGFTAYAIGVYGNFKQGWRESMFHNIFSVATFLGVHVAFYIQGVKFPLESFLMLAAVFAFIDVPKRTTIIETCGIGLAIMGVYYL